MCYLFYPNGDLCYQAETENELENYMVDDFLSNVRLVDFDGYNLPYAVNIDVGTKGQSMEIASFYKKNVDSVVFLDLNGNVTGRIYVDVGSTLLQILKFSNIWGWEVFNEKKKKKIKIKITVPRQSDFY